ncbi:PREDICTED: FERM and PDZ domain-containing protein 1 [Gekko japonicus]|uniref:FERM and PDZ domain-containing protein 1 n=1 Tax=Gekko japonicus TaxID=146911 RepID=A0ABM1KWR2_GEKJA|nr:PREDICTED: FERM and PDZ domain-containing protein 1 [Gekko japonicus]
MEDLESRKARRIEQMVAKWLRRSRDNTARGRTSVSERSSDEFRQSVSRVKITVEIQKDALLGDYGFAVSQDPPFVITSVTSGSAADGKLLPGDHVLAINNEGVEDAASEQIAALLRESEDSLRFTVVRCTSGGPKSSFLTAEKRARLKTNPVKVRFAEEVVVNGHTQGSSLLCMPNVLKVYLENGQTKAFKFDASTTVKDIILTLKEKLSIQSIEYFALVLEEQYNVLKMYLLHDDELITQVVQKKESHNHRCLFRVCFIPRDPLDLLQQDPVAFEYLYLQSCSDVLQERFAVEMKCSVALRLAALHIQERIITCAQPQKVSLKYIAKDWGIENFISPTLLRNMRGKDIKKAISFHMKRNQLLLDPRQKHLLSAAQVRLCYLQILGDLKLYGGKIFNVTLMVRQRENNHVGAKYGISQVVNNKLNIVTMLAEFASISRVELLEESDKVSMVKIYLQDIKLLTLMLESNSAKDLTCLIAGYYKLLVDPTRSIFVWGGGRPQTHRYSTEEGYESRTCSDSEESSEVDSSLDQFSDSHPPKYSRISPLPEEEGEQEELERKGLREQEATFCNGCDNTNDSLSEASDSANTEGRGFKTSGSSDSLDALEEDDLEACSSSRPEFFSFGTPTLQDLTNSDKAFLGMDYENRAASEDFFSFPPPPHLPASALAQSDAEFRMESEINAVVLESKLAENDAMEYYSICANISPASSAEKNTHSDGTEGGSLQDLSAEPSAGEGVGRRGSRGFVLAPPPGFGDTSSEDEFYDAAERVTPTEARTGSGGPSPQNSQDFGIPKVTSCCSLVENMLSRHSKRVLHRAEQEPTRINSPRKRRSFLQTNYTSQVSFPLDPLHTQESIDFMSYGGEVDLSGASCSPAGLSIEDTERDPDPLKARQLVQLDSYREAKNSSSLMEMEPDTLETKSVTDSVVSSISAVRLPGAQESEKSSDFTTGSFSKEEYKSPIISSCTPNQNSSSSTSEIPFQLQDICTEKKEDPTETSCSLQERRAVTTEHETEEIPECMSETPLDTGVSYLLIEEIIHTTTKPPRSVSHQNKQLICEPTLDTGIPPTDEVKNHEQVVLDPCGRVKDDSALCEPSQAFEGELLQENTSKRLSENSFQKSGDQRQLGFSSATELLSDCDDTLGIVTRLSWLSLMSMVDNTEPCWQNDNYQRIIAPSSPGVSQVSLKEGHMLSDCSSPCVHHMLAVTVSHDRSLFAELDSNQETEEEPVTYSATEYENEQPSSLAVPMEEYVEQRKCDHSNGLGYLPFDILCKAVGPSEESSVSGQSFLPSGPTEDAEGPAVCSHEDSPTLNAKEMSSPTHQVDTCRCQFSYASCFHGLDDESVLEDTSPPLQGDSERPLTTPPTRSPLSLDFAPVRSVQECNSVDADPKDCSSHVWLPDSHIKALSHVKDRVHASPLDFCRLLDHVVELQETLKLFWGNRTRHPRDRCLAHFSENKNTLCVESQRLMSSCQKVIKICGLSTEIQGAIQETFRHLLQLTEACFHFTNCGLCSGRHKDLAVNLKDVVCSYHQFVQAAQQAGEKGYPSLSIKLLVCQYTALTAALFCLVQQFKAPPSM